MSEGISIDVGAAVPYLVESIKKWFGKDALTIEVRNMFQDVFRNAYETASCVQCIGMYKPIPIKYIYQKTELSDTPFGNAKTTDIFKLISNDRSSIIFGGPGDGKTTLMHWVFVNLIKNKSYLPMLITLRWPNSIEILKDIVSKLSEEKRLQLARQTSTEFLEQTERWPSKDMRKIVLLVDGYDEISISDRKLVAAALRSFNALEIGSYFLTCRKHYDIIDLPAQQHWINKFNAENALEFCIKFFEAYNIETDSKHMLKQLHDRGFTSFTEHPLMLTLVCILHTAPILSLPRSSIGLVRRAIDTLTLRWDESKGIARCSNLILDGEERVRCLMRIAFYMRSLIASEREILQSTKEHLYRLQIRNVNPKQLLEEMAQWYGILVEVSVEEWGFVHRTIHDFLAARYWVESGEFLVSKIKEWDTRAAYAMSILPDATIYLKRALSQKCEMHILIQCLSNNAIFKPQEIARSVIQYMVDLDMVFVRETVNCTTVEIKPNNDFFAYASTSFLEALINQSNNNPLKNIAEGIIAYCVYELVQRKELLSDSILKIVHNFFHISKGLISVSKANRVIEFEIYSVPRKIKV